MSLGCDRTERIAVTAASVVFMPSERREKGGSKMRIETRVIKNERREEEEVRR